MTIALCSIWDYTGCGNHLIIHAIVEIPLYTSWLQMFSCCYSSGHYCLKWGGNWRLPCLWREWCFRGMTLLRHGNSSINHVYKNYQRSLRELETFRQISLPTDVRSVRSYIICRKWCTEEIPIERSRANHLTKTKKLFSMQRGEK